MDEVTCAGCGKVAPAPGGAAPLGWSTDLAEETPSFWCPDCARAHARSIEAKLPSEWW